MAESALQQQVEQLEAQVQRLMREIYGDGGATAATRPAATPPSGVSSETVQSRGMQAKEPLFRKTRPSGRLPTVFLAGWRTLPPETNWLQEMKAMVQLAPFKVVYDEEAGPADYVMIYKFAVGSRPSVGDVMQFARSYRDRRVLVLFVPDDKSKVIDPSIVPGLPVMTFQTPRVAKGSKIDATKTRFMTGINYKDSYGREAAFDRLYWDAFLAGQRSLHGHFSV